ncbi:hypothetical protein [Modestobacter sp. VKM Ac-2985]|uniref:hypothetical protein n=1 Tax=Modestobacter sp. VKM Ac-2985 TaxID=3004139 RepID=UPI0022AB70F8|nr:hypothetical protein [Modestobacter sp. VKM Ac-2985]MCZ2839775.1 hypothetical protein [Modestobacter sp. VKM Ac-2985]
MPRVWTALLLLAAVFGVHGVQCTMPDPTLGHESVTVAPTASVDVPAAAAAGPIVVAAAMRGHQHAALPGTGGAGDPGSLAPWHDGHVLAFCLAALLAGLTVMGASSRLRGLAVRLAGGRPTSPHCTTGWSRQPRPPDLAALCLLRI